MLLDSYTYTKKGKQHFKDECKMRCLDNLLQQLTKDNNLEIKEKAYKIIKKIYNLSIKEKYSNLFKF